MVKLMSICVICLFLGIIAAQADVTIDKKYKDRIDIGPNPVIDWVQVDCTTHISLDNRVVNDFCDYSDIQTVKELPDPGEYVISKSHSRWGFKIGRRQEDSILLLDAKF